MSREYLLTSPRTLQAFPEMSAKLGTTRQLGNEAPQPPYGAVTSHRENAL